MTPFEKRGWNTDTSKLIFRGQPWRMSADFCIWGESMDRGLRHSYCMTHWHYEHISHPPIYFSLPLFFFRPTISDYCIELPINDNWVKLRGIISRLDGETWESWFKRSFFFDSVHGRNQYHRIWLMIRLGWIFGISSLIVVRIRCIGSFEKFSFHHFEVFRYAFKILSKCFKLPEGTLHFFNLFTSLPNYLLHLKKTYRQKTVRLKSRS